MARVQDSMDNPWWRAMYVRYSKHDPSNVNYGTYNNPGLNTTLTVASNPDFAVQLKRYQNGIDKYNVGGISKMGVRMQNQINACSSQTGAPDGCALNYLGADAYYGVSTTYENV
jgi:hypothetical protein